MDKLLIVDDVEDYLVSLRRALSDEWTVSCASSLKEALELLQTASPDVALIDVRLSEADPGNRDGVTLLKWVRDRSPETPVLLMSAYRDFDAAVEALNLGAHQFLKKPIDLRNLKGLLRSLAKSKPPERG
jgi:DNA-binding NtrC family response regulator